MKVAGRIDGAVLPAGMEVWRVFRQMTSVYPLDGAAIPAAKPENIHLKFVADFASTIPRACRLLKKMVSEGSSPARNA